jgi:hypothetical protein
LRFEFKVSNAETRAGMAEADAITRARRASFTGATDLLQ